MFDLHCHLLPGIDDGAVDLDRALAMARLAVDDDTTTIACMPHLHRTMTTGRIPRGDQVMVLLENHSTCLPLGVKHWLENPGRVPLQLIDVQSGSYLGDDIVRFGDVYGCG